MKSSTTIFSRFALLICAGLVCVTGRFSESSARTALFADPYIATSQNYFCAGQADPISLYCNVLAYDPSTNVDDWTFEWSPAGEVSDPNAQSVEITPNTTTVYSAVMTSPSGEVFVDDITIVVYDEFSVDAGSDMALCSTIGAGLSANASTSDPVTWLWEPAIGLNNPSLQNPQVLDEISQTYTVTATIAGLGGDGCYSSDVIDVISIFPDMSLGTDVVACEGDVVVIDPGLPVNFTFDWSVTGESLPVLEVSNSGSYGLTATSPEGCVHSDVVDVLFSQGPLLALPDSTTVCASAGVILDATPLNLATGPFSFNWSSGETVADPTFNTSGTYQVLVADSGGCTSAASVVVEALQSPEFDFPEDTTMCFEDFPTAEYVLGVPAGFASYQWWDGQTSHVISVDGPGAYGVIVTNDIGCETEKWTNVTDFCSMPLLFIPSAFTPDGDGLNEVLKIEGRNLVQLEFKLYNRWGGLVWEADSIGDYWHGQGPEKSHYVQDDLFLWKAKYRYYTDPSGTLSTWFEEHGSIRILR